MRLHRLTLRNFRGVKDRTVELPALGTTVVVGDNEVGKSSLVEAFGLIFDFPDDSKSTRIRDIQPVGQDVAPEVTAELTLGGRELTYTKRWLKSRSTELTVVEPGGRRRSWTGREAHNEAERLFAENVDPVLWRTLMVGQGQSLVLPSPADAEPLITAVTAESGTPVDGASMPLVTAVEQEYLRYWTRGGRPTGEFARSAQTVAAAQAAATQAARAMDEVAADIRRAERLALDLTDLTGRLGDHLEAVEVLRARKQATDEILLRRDAIKHRAALAKSRLEHHTRTRRERERLLSDVERLTEAQADLTASRARCRHGRPQVRGHRTGGRGRARGGRRAAGRAAHRDARGGTAGLVADGPGRTRPADRSAGRTRRGPGADRRREQCAGRHPGGRGGRHQARERA
jgi:hypothetical protein